jgi:lipopolysaccharide biosynthesis protein
LLRTLVAAQIKLHDFEPEPIAPDGCLAHAVERMFGLICEDAGMRVVESGQIADIVRQSAYGRSSRVHIIALYLPQFHPIRENDEWWGTGFTEWANVTQAKSLFSGHRQPRLPSDLGFCDLRLPETREAQAELALRYGLSAFCYYYYWFDGRRVLERPLDEVLASGKPDFPFLICWANEPWTRNWDGLSRDVLLTQTYEPGWTARFARDITPLLHDRRYFRLDGKPMVLIYRVGNIPESTCRMREIRAALLEEGIPDVHLAAAWVSFEEDSVLPADPNVLGLDSYFEFPPHRCPVQQRRPLPSDLPEGFAGDVYDYDRTVTAVLAELRDSHKGRRHRGIMAGWDNTARRGANAYIFHGATPANFRRWLRGTILHERSQDGDRVIVVNAWNEWAEGTYLEPDRDFGCGWLEAVASATDGEWSRTQITNAYSETKHSGGHPLSSYEPRDRGTNA